MNRLQQRRLHTQLQVEQMITHHQLDGEPAVEILKAVMDDYLIKGGARSHTLTLLLKRDMSREIVVKLYDNPMKDDLIKIQAKQPKQSNQNAKSTKSTNLSKKRYK